VCIWEGRKLGTAQIQTTILGRSNRLSHIAQIKLCKSRGQLKASLRAFCVMYICLSAILSSRTTKATLYVASWSAQIVSRGQVQIHEGEYMLEQSALTLISSLCQLLNNDFIPNYCEGVGSWRTISTTTIGLGGGRELCRTR
jgi:hypothetical protein